MLKCPAPLLSSLRWCLKVLGVGAVPAGLAGALLGGGDRWEYARHSATIGVIFAGVMWGGFDLAHRWVGRHDAGGSPLRAAVMAQFRWLLLYGLLLGVATLLVRAVLGWALWRHPTTYFVTALMGLFISSFILSFHTTLNLVTTARELERARAQAGFLALQAQLSPHTLFNALNTIAALIPEEPGKAEVATEHLARLLRQVLGALEREAWTLDEEFGLIGELLALERLRFGERLRFELRLAPEEAGRPVPPLLLLPLVENALKHGFRPKPGPCFLRVEAAAGRVRLTDDGVGLGARAGGGPGPDAEGVGLRTVRQRLEAVGGALIWPPSEAGCAVEVRW